MEINTYLKNLLMLHDCVIIPELGAFISSESSAQVDISKQLFIPPKRKVAFNSSISNNDGLLVNYISKELSVSYKEANELVAKFVVDVNSNIESTTNYNFDGIGKLSLVNNRLEFTPVSSGLVSTESYGLNSFNFPLLKSNQENRIEETKKVIDNTSKKISTVRKKNGSRKFAITSLSTAAAIAALVVLSLQYNVFSDFSNTQFASFFSSVFDKNDTELVIDDVQSNPEEVIVKEIVEPIANDELIEGNIVDETLVVVEEPAVSETVVEEKEVVAEKVEPVIIETKVLVAKHYHAIIGSFKTLKTAQDVIDNSSNPSEMRIIQANNKIRVAGKSYETYNEAVGDLPNVRNELNPQAWVLVY